MSFSFSRSLVACGVLAVSPLVALALSDTANGSSSYVPVLSGSSAGSIQGVVRKADGMPEAGSVVMLSAVTGGELRTTYSNFQGEYVFRGIAAGNYALHVQSSDPTNTDTTLAFNGSGHAIVDLMIQNRGGAQAPVAPAPPTSSNLTGNFFQRLGQFYGEDWKGTVPSGPEPKRRGYAAPLDSEPFPAADWNYGGSPDIGAPDGATYPLMEAINGSNSRTKIYGWFNGGFDVSTSNRGKFANAPAAYYVSPNTLIPDQQVLYIERLPDTVQTDHIDWGFRLAQLYGQDYRYTTAKGIFSQQLLSSNNIYGYDPVMFYVDVYFPHVAQGMNIRMGRYISLPDIEAQLAPNNYTYSHSLLYTIDPYTQTGIVASIKLSDHWMTQVGFSGGNDVAPWTKDVTPTLTACASYTWNQGGDMLYPCINSLNNGKYAYNNLQSYYLTWYHKINASWHTDTETWYMYERDVPNIAGNVANPITPETGANGAFCPTSVLRCTAPEFAVVNYVEKEFTKKDYLSIRNEFVNDERGQRTGYVTRYSEHLISYGHWIGSTILIRPEIRYEHSYNEAAYDLGTKKSQFIVAGDVTYHF